MAEIWDIAPKSEGERPVVIEAENVWKKFKIYHERNPSLKETLLKGRRSAYETFWALKDVSFKVRQGTTIGFIGENGSGKSTLLKLLTKILRPNKGSISMHGKVSALLELGAGFHPELTGKENIFLNGSILGLSKADIFDRLDEIIAFSELEKFIDSPVKNYSSGMYVRLGFAVAINVEPDILLIDEILAVGDEAFQRKCLNKLFDLKESGKTIVMVSHALDSIRNICDEAIWLEHGEIKATGPAPAVVDAYLDEVNRQEGEGSADAGQPEFGSRWGSGEIKIKAVRLLDEKGTAKPLFITGEPFTVEIDYEAKEEISRPVFGVAIHSREGIHINGTNTKFYKTIFDTIKGEGTVRYSVNELPLLKGNYVLSAVVYDYACLHAYDHHDKCYLFNVSSGELSDYGVFHIPCSWTLIEKDGR
ncbi:MAG TPA: ABC transporter ATP-binding protein [Actinobacteria bacterium]|nr:ABC transporter ATP-binding protein [Actinomycetota bacterium]